MPVRRLVYLRAKEIFRYLQQSAQPRYGPGFYRQFSSCATKKEYPKLMTVESPGTSFARLVPERPTFANFPTFPQPCGSSQEE